ncbi:MAG: hypothetical protein AAF533_05240 [Acidobacteriota bacterium]
MTEPVSLTSWVVLSSLSIYWLAVGLVGYLAFRCWPRELPPEALAKETLLWGAVSLGGTAAVMLGHVWYLCRLGLEHLLEIDGRWGNPAGLLALVFLVTAGAALVVVSRSRRRMATA